MSNHVLFAGLLLLSLGVVGIVYLNGVIQDVYCREAVGGVDFVGVDSTGMALRYTAHQLNGTLCWGRTRVCTVEQREYCC